MSTTSAIITDVRSRLAGDPVFLAGSLVAADVYGYDTAFTDVDLFVPTSQVLIATGQKLLSQGFTFGDRFDRVWARWMRYGFKSWHTNSLKLIHPGNGVEWNLVYKLTEGHAATSLGEVIESFDFGLLAVGWDLEHNMFRDMDAFLFPDQHGLDLITGPVYGYGPRPLMPNKRSNWRQGFISQYNGLREAGRYAKYSEYGYDLSLVKDDLVTGYDQAWLYLSGCDDAEKQQLGQIYQAIGRHIAADDIAAIKKAMAHIEYKDALDAIMEALE